MSVNFFSCTSLLALPSAVSGLFNKLGTPKAVPQKYFGKYKVKIKPKSKKKDVFYFIWATSGRGGTNG